MYGHVSAISSYQLPNDLLIAIFYFRVDVFLRIFRTTLYGQPNRREIRTNDLYTLLMRRHP